VTLEGSGRIWKSLGGIRILYKILGLFGGSWRLYIDSGGFRRLFDSLRIYRRLQEAAV
jgi:hypothetical protein